jgi:hypothetical protein
MKSKAPFNIVSLLFPLYSAYSDLHHTAQDIARLVNREAKLVERTNNRSPSPEVPRSRSPPPVTGALKRVFNSVAGEFEIARCVERSDHALKVLIVSSVTISRE